MPEAKVRVMVSLLREYSSNILLMEDKGEKERKRIIRERRQGKDDKGEKAREIRKIKKGKGR